MVDLSIIIVSYNTQKLTLQCVDSIFRSLKLNPSIRTEIIIIDNGSSDETINQLKKFCLKNQEYEINIILNKNNVGFGKANNQGVKKAKGKYILFLNSDIIVLNDAIPLLYKKISSSHNRYDFIGAKLLNKDMSPQASCGPEYNLFIVFIWLLFRGDHLGISRYSPNKEKKVNWVSGACFITQKNTYESLKGFDENIFMYMEEVDLFMRAKKMGYNVCFYPNSKFIHLGSASSSGKSQPIVQVFSGLLYLYQKHYSNNKLLILKIVLKLKARVSILVGRLLKNNYLIDTYEKALSIIEKDR